MDDHHSQDGFDEEAFAVLTFLEKQGKIYQDSNGGWHINGNLKGECDE